MPLVVLLSLAPIGLTYAAWRFHTKLDPPLSKARRLLFRSGLLWCILSSLTVVGSWLDPFRLLPDGQGGYSDIRNTMLFDAGLATALLTIGLAVFGRGPARLFLLGSGFLLAVLAFGAALQNGV